MGVRAGTQAARAVLTDGLGLESAGPAALAFTFAVDGGHLDLVGGLRLQANDGDLGQVCWRRGGVNPCGHTKEQEMFNEESDMFPVLFVLMCEARLTTEAAVDGVQQVYQRDAQTRLSFKTQTDESLRCDFVSAIVCGGFHTFLFLFICEMSSLILPFHVPLNHFDFESCFMWKTKNHLCES